MHGILDLFRNIVSMTDDEKKNRLVEIKKNQIVRESLTNDDNLLPMEEMESIAILESLIQSRSNEPIEVTMGKIIALRDEIDARALKNS